MKLKRYRPNVAALVQCEQKYVACLRSRHPGWQCVQGGIDADDESPEHAIVREMQEELGVEKSEISILQRSQCWRRYDFLSNRKMYDGQEQLWFLIEIPSLNSVRLAQATSDEFSEVKLMEVHELVLRYVGWKQLPFFDFCRELSLI